MAAKGKSPSSQDRRAKIAAATPRGARGPSRLMIAGVVLIIAVIAVVGAVIVADQASKSKASSGGSALPAGAAKMGAGLTAFPNATLVKGAPTLDIYEDFQCPICGEFEKIFGSTVDQLGSSGKAKINYHILTFLDDNLGNDSSSRAANAATCAADQGKFIEYHNAVYAGQPAKEGQGYTDAQLKQFAETAGLSGDALSTWQTCYDNREHNQYIQSVQEQASKDGVNGTPTVKLNGTTMNLSNMTPASFAQAVAAATK